MPLDSGVSWLVTRTRLLPHVIDLPHIPPFNVGQLAGDRAPRCAEANQGKERWSDAELCFVILHEPDPAMKLWALGRMCHHSSAPGPSHGSGVAVC